MHPISRFVYSVYSLPAGFVGFYLVIIAVASVASGAVRSCRPAGCSTADASAPSDLLSSLCSPAIRTFLKASRWASEVFFSLASPKAGYWA